MMNIPAHSLHSGARYAAAAALVALAPLLSTWCAAATIPIPNPSFEVGTSAPVGWTLNGGQGRWEQTGAEGRSISVTGSGEDQNAWESAPTPLKPGHLYRLRVLARWRGDPGGVATVGVSSNNRDFTAGDINRGSSWTPLSFVFCTPTNSPPEGLRLHLGQWHTHATISFDQMSITDVTPVYARHTTRQGIVELGEGEEVNGQHYQAQAVMNGEGSNSSRFLQSDTTGFNTDRWLLNTGSSVIYHHSLPGLKQLQASVTLNENYHISGACTVEARNGGAWIPVGQLEGQGSRTFALPAALFPADSIDVRLAGADLAGRSAELQVNSYRYEADLDHGLPRWSGQTHFAELVTGFGSAITVQDWGSLKPGEGAQAKIAVGALPATVRWQVTDSAGKDALHGIIHLAAGDRRRLVIVPYQVQRAGPNTLELQVLRTGQTIFAARVLFSVSPLDAADYGCRGTADGQLWWAEGAFKIGRTRPAPDGKIVPLQLSAARGEEQALQLVLRPARLIENAAITVSPLRNAAGSTLSSSICKIFHVESVRVNQPTDAEGGAGDWPDPLLPYTGPFTARPGENHPLWLSITVPPVAAGGLYRGTVRVQAGQQLWTIPLRLQVRDFSLPAHPHLRSAMGITPDTLRSYHNLHTDADLRRVWEQYMQDFAAHHLDPSNPMALDPIRVVFTGDADHRTVQLETAAFDRAAHHYLDEMGFNAFDLPVEGMGGGTFYERRGGEFGGFKAGTPEYNALWGSYVKQLEAHLREKGWLRKAYVYWFDEPSVADFPFVREGMERLKQAAPGLTRLLTKEPRPELVGSVNLWCPILDAYQHSRAAERQQQGDEVWWYICTGPRAPYPGEFIDHPDTDLRVWVWDTWQQNVQGLLIWETTYWQSPTAYPDRLQDPWTDPMSWVSGYGTPAGARQPWGNGDGRFLYPPPASLRAAGKPILTGPIDSIRWEMLREGIQDYEYFWLLRDLLSRARGLSAAEIAHDRALLQVPPAVAQSLTRYSPDPRPLYQHRALLAEAIERLYARHEP